MGTSVNTFMVGGTRVCVWGLGGCHSPAAGVSLCLCIQNEREHQVGQKGRGRRGRAGSGERSSMVDGGCWRKDGDAKGGGGKEHDRHLFHNSGYADKREWNGCEW